MKKTLLLFYFTLTTSLKAEVYCRTEPISANGDDYVIIDNTIETACAKALQKCEAHYKYCVILACGQMGNIQLDDLCEIGEQVEHGKFGR